MAQKCEYCGGPNENGGPFCCPACELDSRDGMAEATWRDYNEVDPAEYLDDLAEYNNAEADDYRDEGDGRWEDEPPEYPW